MGNWLERNRGIVLILLLNLAVVGGLFFWFQRPVSSPVEITPPDPTPSPVITSTPTMALIRVYITGAVIYPDVYRLAPGSIVKDAIEAAGGITDDADLVRINLAQELQDQQQIYVPHKDEVNAPPPVVDGQSRSSSGSVESSGQININTATIEELDTLPGIGPGYAQRIIEYREQNGPFGAIEEITLVSGIGDATFEKIRDRITVGD
jgi:competence protein ComEA